MAISVLLTAPNIARAGGARTRVEIPEIDITAQATKDLLGVADTAIRTNGVPVRSQSRRSSK
jgi:hypothetical protein